MQARKKYGIKYPNLYAPPGHKNEEAFNCAQRARPEHRRAMPLFLVELVLVGLFYRSSPRAAAASERGPHFYMDTATKQRARTAG